MLKNFLSKTEFSSYEDFYSNFKVNVPQNFNFVYDIVDKIANETPQKTAMVWIGDDGKKKVFSFEDMRYYSLKTAEMLRKYNIGKGDPVMLILKRRFEFWFVLLALHRLGAVAIPATHLLTKKDIIYRNNAASVKMIIAVSEETICDSISASIPESPTLENVITVGEKSNFIDYYEQMDSVDVENISIDRNTENTDPMLLYFTSGTTGMPKMVKHNYLYPVGHLVTAGYWQNVRDGGLHLTVAETGWAKAAWGKIYGQWIAGAAVFTYDFEKFDAVKLLEVISDNKVTSFCAPPTVYRFFIKEDLSKYDLSALEHCSVAGEPLNPEVYDQWLEKTGHQLMEGYGQTELTLTVGTFQWMKPKPGSMGKPAPGYSVLLINDKGEIAGNGEEGEIVIDMRSGKAPGIFDGYHRDEELTNKVFHDGFYYTGDIATMDGDGYMWFVGRKDDIIKSSGYRIGPFEVESALMEHPAVMECAITAVPDAIRGQIVKATVVLSRGYKACENLIKDLQDHVKKATAPYKYPRIIEFVKELPKTISGKIRRVEIRAKNDKEVKTPFCTNSGNK